MTLSLSFYFQKFDSEGETSSFFPNTLDYLNFIMWSNVSLPLRLGGFKCMCTGSVEFFGLTYGFVCYFLPLLTSWITSQNTKTFVPALIDLIFSFIRYKEGFSLIGIYNSSYNFNINTTLHCFWLYITLKNTPPCQV